MTYDYECRRGHRFSVQQRITDAPLKTCDRDLYDPSEVIRRGDGVGAQLRRCRCRVRRLISAPAFHLSGGGWSSTGYSK